MQGIQKVIEEIIKESKENGLPYITTHAIIEEAKKTSLSSKATEFVTMNGKVDNEYDKLTAATWQALMNLKNKGKIRNTSHGKWTIKAHTEKYQPSICKALIPEYKQSCSNENCDWYELVKGENKPKKQNCPKCGKKTEVEFNRQYCPIKTMYIAKPEEQCELLHGYDSTKKSKYSYPMKPCYFNKKPSALEVEYAIKKLRKLAEKEEQERATKTEHT